MGAAQLIDNQTTSYLSELTVVLTTLLTQHNYHTDRIATNDTAAAFKHHNTHTKQSTYPNTQLHTLTWWLSS